MKRATYRAKGFYYTLTLPVYAPQAMEPAQVGKGVGGIQDVVADALYEKGLLDNNAHWTMGPATWAFEKEIKQEGGADTGTALPTRERSD